MTENINPNDESPSTSSGGCINCANPVILKGYPNDLCAECREKFIKFPIPGWIKLFAAAICLLVIFGLFKLPQSLSMGTTFEKGINAEEEKKYMTEAKQMQAVLKMNPDYKDAKAHLMIASFYNSDLLTFSQMASDLSGATLSDDDLFNRVDLLMKTAADYYPSDSLIEWAKQNPDSSNGLTEDIVLNYLKKYPDDLFAKSQYASLLYEKAAYTSCDSICREILKTDKDYLPVLNLLPGLKRMEGDTKGSLEYCDHMLSLNKESVYAISCKARTLLKLDRNKEALELALQSIALDANDAYSNATLAMAYHFNKMIKERDAVIEKVKQSQDSSAIQYIQYAIDVIGDKEKL